MAHVLQPLDIPSTYRDRQAKHDRSEERKKLERSSTLYVGNLSFYTTEAQIYELFSQCAEPRSGGGLKRIIMGLDRHSKTPCGFAFVEYYLHAEARAAMRYLSGTKLDERVIRCDLDPGFVEGRQFGRGKSGGQVRDEYREEYDAGRGGWGHQTAQQLARQQEQDRLRSEQHYDTYASAQGGLGNEMMAPRGEGVRDTPSGRKRGRSVDSDEDAVDEFGRSVAPPLRGERDNDDF